MSLITVRRATSDDSSAVAEMVDALLSEIMATIGEAAFDSDTEAMQDQLRDSLPSEKYFVLLAEKALVPVGFAALSPAYALYTNGPFGVLTELYVMPDHRSQTVGERLILECRSLAEAMGWSRLEVTTPPLPEFDRSLEFYLSQGFVNTGGRKLKLATN